MRKKMCVCVCIKKWIFADEALCFCFNKRMDIIIQTKRNKSTHFRTKAQLNGTRDDQTREHLFFFIFFIRHSVQFSSVFVGIVVVSHEINRTLQRLWIVMYLFKLFWSLSASSASHSNRNDFFFSLFSFRFRRYLFAATVQQLFKYYFRFIYFSTISFLAFISASRRVW